MMLKDLLLNNRSYRRFMESERISSDELFEMIDAARLSASARNSQPLKYFISTEKKFNEKIFSTLAWAGYLKDWDGPKVGERPAAYLVQMLDRDIASNYFCDDGIAAQSILLTAVEMGYGGCIIASVKREKLAGILELPENLQILQVIALGKPAEEVVLEEIRNNDIKYWRDDREVHHVPKRTVKELVFGIKS